MGVAVGVGVGVSVGVGVGDGVGLGVAAINCTAMKVGLLNPELAKSVPFPAESNFSIVSLP